MPYPDAIPLSRTVINFHGVDFRVGLLVKVVKQSETVNRFVETIGMIGTLQGFARVPWALGASPVLCAELLSLDRQRGYVPLGCLEPDDTTLATYQRQARHAQARAIRHAAKTTGLDVDDVEEVLAAYFNAMGDV